jgi:hypothetical protein
MKKIELDRSFGWGLGANYRLPKTRVETKDQEYDQWKQKMYFGIGDILTPAIIGGLTGLCNFWIVGTGWNMFLAMFFGMIVGMALQVLVFLIFMPLFGAMEVMIPSMISGMLGGMISGMIAATYVLPSSLGFVLGGGIGIMVCLWVYLRSRYLQGETQ